MSGFVIFSVLSFTQIEHPELREARIRKFTLQICNNKQHNKKTHQKTLDFSW